MARDSNRKRSSKPCPGCGYQPEKRAYNSRSTILFRYEDGVCQKCEDLLAGQRKFVEALEALPGWVAYTMSPQWFRIRLEGTGRWELREEINKALDKLVASLLPVNAAATKVLRDHWSDPDIPSARVNQSYRVVGGQRLFLPEGAPEVLEECRKLLAEALMENYQHGLGEGLDMVRGLQAGELTNVEFTKLATRRQGMEAE